MRLSHREILLGWLTLIIVLIVLTWLWFEPRFQKSRDYSVDRATAKEMIQRARHLLDQEEEWNTRLAVLRARLPRYPEDQEVTADLLRSVQRIAQEYGLNLLRASPGSERRVDELYEVSIDYTWEGVLPALNRFLYATQIQQVNMDVRMLNITPETGGRGGLRGQMTIDIAYTRGEPLPGQEQAAEMRAAEIAPPAPQTVTEQADEDTGTVDDESLMHDQE